MKQDERKRKLRVGFLVTCLLMLILSMTAQAATNPFKNVSTTTHKEIICSAGGKGCDFFATYTQKVTVTATSSNKKVATTKIYSYSWKQDGKTYYQKGVFVKQKGYGTTKIKITVKVAKKTYSKTFTYTFYKYQNPFSSIKVGGKNYTAKFTKPVNVSVMECTRGGKAIKIGNANGKLVYKLKSGYKIESITAYKIKASDDGKPYSISVKNNGKIPSGYNLGMIRYKNTKTGAIGYISVI